MAMVYAEPPHEVLQVARNFFAAFLKKTIDQSQLDDLDDVIREIWRDHDEATIERLVHLPEVRLDSAQAVQEAGADLVAHNLRLSLWTLKTGSRTLFDIAPGTTPTYRMPSGTTFGLRTLTGGAGVDPPPGGIEVPGD